jgi:hypothetical protein
MRKINLTRVRAAKRSKSFEIENRLNQFPCTRGSRRLVVLFLTFETENNFSFPPH